MKNSQALWTIGSIVGMGIAGVVASVILTRHEEYETVRSAQHVPVTLTDPDGNNIVPNNRNFAIVVDTTGSPISEDVDFFVQVGTDPADAPFRTRRHPKLNKARLRSKNRQRITVPALGFTNVTSSEPVLIRVTGISENEFLIYEGELKVTLVP